MRVVEFSRFQWNYYMSGRCIPTKSFSGDANCPRRGLHSSNGFYCLQLMIEKCRGQVNELQSTAFAICIAAYCKRKRFRLSAGERRSLLCTSDTSGVYAAAGDDPFRSRASRLCAAARSDRRSPLRREGEPYEAIASCVRNVAARLLVF